MLLPLTSNDEAHAPRILLAHDGGSTELRGPAASRALGVLLAQANQWGASAPQVRAAVRTIEERGDAAGWLRVAARRSSRPYGRVMAEWRRVGAFSLTPIERLAVEMALHEAQERAVLEGELAHLALAWESAEEIAAIADAL
jgi:Ser/Thr protein kinase RdoA (MazF antagonist)